MRTARVLASLAIAMTGLWLLDGQVRADDKKSADQAFIRTADEIGQAEMKLGRLAEQNATSDAVKKFGARMVEDHMRLSKELRDLASQKGISLPDGLDQKHQQLMEQLTKLRGADFDRAYTGDMVEGHQKAIDQFETEAKSGQDPDVKAWAEKSLSTLREHLRMAQQLAKEIKGG
jgi:putative membrane protein